MVRRHQRDVQILILIYNNLNCLSLQRFDMLKEHCEGDNFKMCGIFGLLVKEDPNLKTRLVTESINHLFKLSESRGKEASGVAVFSDNLIRVLKLPLPASQLIHTEDYQKLFTGFSKKDVLSPLAIIGHTRLATDGAETFKGNNQPVIKDGIIIVHNGIVVNDGALWKRFPSLKRKYEVDTEIIPSLIRKFYREKKDLTRAVKKTFDLVEGSVSIAAFFNDFHYLLLATNTGSLYVCKDKRVNICLFASESYILKKILQQRWLQNIFTKSSISQIKPGFGYLIDIPSFKLNGFFLGQGKSRVSSKPKKTTPRAEIIDLSSPKTLSRAAVKKTIKRPSKNYPSLFRGFSKIEASVNLLRRCKRCILPETMPFIEFDKHGVCNYCRDYRKMRLKGKTALLQIANRYRSKKGRPACIVAFSGGRDSSFGLHYIKKILKMHPVAYSYDWGMLTDLGRRNQARMCGKLGVEHILVSADIKKKREYIKKNVTAWLKKPQLGMVPLFMAGDKQYFYYANKIMKQTGARLLFMSENPLERTHFKHGFCGVKHSLSDKPPYFLSLMDKVRLVAYYAKQYCLNPAYINSSLADTISAYFSYYIMPRNFIYLYDYIKWDEKKILSTLINEYNWERLANNKTTWRIGDGTAAFYNYIYYIVAGFTENDTFRSNQIREGMITRQKALKLAKEENRPRFDSIKWYCDTVGIDFHKTLKIINKIAKLFKATRASQRQRDCSGRA